MSIAIIQGQDTIPVGELWDEIGIIEGPDGKTMVRRVYRTINRVFGPHLDTTVSSLPDFAPVSKRTYSSVVADSLAFGPTDVRGWVETQTGGMRSIHRRLPPGLIAAGSFDLLVRTAALGPGWTTETNAYLAAFDSIHQLRAVVTGAETLRQRDAEQVETWRVEGTFGDLPLTMWIHKQTRAMVQELIRVTPDVAMLMRR
jgi:hypothetical protein